MRFKKADGGEVEIKPDSIWRHNASGNPYIVSECCAVKIDGVWHEGVAYYAYDGEDKDDGDRMLYVRKVVDFIERFTLEKP